MEYSFHCLYLCIVEKKEKIIHAAMKLLTDNGVQATPMSAIAKAAETGMGTIYNYFPTKEDLINAIYLYIKEEEVKHVLTPFEDESVRKQFDHYYGGITTYLITHPDHFQFMDQFHNSPILTDITRDEGLKAFQPVLALIVKGQQQGIIKTISVDELMQFLNGGLMGFVRWMLGARKKLTPELLSNQLRIAWDAVKQ